MTKDPSVRELKFSPTQLVVVFLAIILLGVFVFLLGISVAKKQTQLAAQAVPTPAVKAEPAAAKPAVPAEVTTSVAPAQAQASTTIPPAEAKAQPVPETKLAPQKPVEKPAEKKTTEGPPPAAKQQAGAKPEAKKTEKPQASAYQKAPYYVQVSAVENKEAADAFAKRIAGLGYPTVVLDPFATDKKPVYRVRVGPFESKEEATEMTAKIAAALKKKKTDFFIIKG